MLEEYDLKLLPNLGMRGSYTIGYFDKNGEEIGYREYLERQPKKSLDELIKKLLGN